MVMVLVACGCAQKTYLVKEGMSKEEVLALWGKPVKIETSKNTCCWERNEEAWLYYKTSYRPHETRRFVLFEDNRVSSYERWGKIKRNTL